MASIISIPSVQALGSSLSLNQAGAIAREVGVQNRSIPLEKRTQAMFSYDELRRLLWSMRPYGDIAPSGSKGSLIDTRS